MARVTRPPPPRKGDKVASFRNIRVNDQGVNIVVTYLWNNDQQTGPWQETSVSFPSAFGDLPVDESVTIMHELAVRVNEARGVHE